MDLGCRNESHLVQISNAVFMAGFGVGGLVHGLGADLFGRKPALVFSALCLPVVGLATAAVADEVTTRRRRRWRRKRRRKRRVDA